MTNAAVARSVRIPLDGAATLDADLTVPRDAIGIVVFAHGSGSSRSSPRNRFVAEQLQRARLATLLSDLLTVDEERIDRVTAEFRFDIELLTDRLERAVVWALRDDATAGLPVGLFGASTGAAAALAVAARRRESIGAVVSRGGRPDLAGDHLRAVRAPVLLIVGGDDRQVLELNRSAASTLECEWRLEIVPGATHLFEEPGALGEVARRASEWFRQHLATGRGPDGGGVSDQGL